ncbi:MAG: phasin family protein [Proteobacteria bacterium]|nr:phasin family protein [Pseudomonadota bacterium]MBI3497645.1 phasin family protein [Pseudomonadota bacterium]
MAKNNPFFNADKSNPFFNVDMQKLLGDFKFPGVDYEALMTSQRRNIEALTQANQLAVEGMQAVAKRQAEIMRQTMEETGRAMQALMQSTTPEDRMAKQTDMVKSAFERAIANMRELAELVTKSNAEAFQLVNQRVTDSLDELKQAIGKQAKH